MSLCHLLAEPPQQSKLLADKIHQFSKKNGHRRGKQNYLCHACKRQFVESYSPQGYVDEIKEECLKMYVNDMRFRDIERVLGVHNTTVVNWTKVATPVSDTPEAAEIPEVTQLDE